MGDRPLGTYPLVSLRVRHPHFLPRKRTLIHLSGLTIGRVALLWVNKTVRRVSMLPTRTVLTLNTDRRALRHLHLRPPRNRARDRRLARAVPRWGCRRSLARRRRSRAYLPDRDEPLRAYPPTVAAHGVHWLDRGLRAGRFRALAVRDGSARAEGGDQESPAAVSGIVHVVLCTSRLTLLLSGGGQAGVDDGFHGVPVGRRAQSPSPSGVSP